jgi:uncharacterized protein YdcH (DUF465 family)
MDVTEERDLLARIEEENEEYRKLKAKHHEYDEKLRELAGKRVLTEEEKVEEVRMKKEKLFLKDRMAAMQREFLASQQ